MSLIHKTWQDLLDHIASNILKKNDILKLKYYIFLLIPILREVRCFVIMSYFIDYFSY